MSRRTAIVAGLLVAVALAVAGVAAVVLQGMPDRPSAAAPVQIGGSFELVSQTGEPFSSRSLAGTPFAIFFGFTHCPEICPTTLYEISESLKQLGSESDSLKVLFVTVDPERDTPEFLSAYLGNFDPRIVGLTGAPERIEEVAKLYRVYYRKVPTGDGGYTMDHTAITYLMGRDGLYVDHIGYGASPEERLRKLRRLIEQG